MEPIYKIRKASPSDVDTIFNFISHLEERSFDFKSFKERYIENLDKEDVIYLVAINEGDEAIGFISCHGQSLLHHEGKVFEIQEIYVARNSRSKGVGKALIASILDKLAELNCESLEVTTNQVRSDAKRFYSKLGFQHTHLKFVKIF